MMGIGRGCALAATVMMMLAMAACATSTAPAATGTAASSAATHAPAPSLRRQTVAVLPFTNDGVGGHERLDFLREWLPDTVGAALGSSGELRVIERRQLLRVLQEQKLGASALASQEGRLELGKLSGAQTMVFGSFAAIGDVLQVSARIVDVESGVILKSSTVRGDVASARSLGESLSRELAKNLGLGVEQAAAAAGVADSRALAEAELFYQGVAQERQGETDRAIETFQKALAIDPNDREARQHLKKLLGSSH